MERNFSIILTNKLTPSYFKKSFKTLNFIMVFKILKVIKSYINLSVHTHFESWNKDKTQIRKKLVFLNSQEHNTNINKKISNDKL